MAIFPYPLAHPTLLSDCESSSSIPWGITGAGFGWEELGQKAIQHRYAWDGRVLFTILTSPPSDEHALEPQGRIERASTGLHSAFGQHDTNQLE